MRVALKVFLAAAALTVVETSSSFACGRGWNVDAYGRCFPAELGDGVYTGNRPHAGDYYAPRGYYAPRYYGGQPYYYRERRYDPGAAIALGIAGAAAAAIASQSRYHHPRKRYRHR